MRFSYAKDKEVIMALDPQQEREQAIGELFRTLFGFANHQPSRRFISIIATDTSFSRVIPSPI